jgi:hypothetical protein
MFADGVYYESNHSNPAYFRDWGNLFDFLIVCLGTIEIIMVGSGMTGVGLTALRALRALRVIKIIKGFENIRLVTSVIIESLPSIVSIFILGVVVIIFYGKMSF